jgi:decaprenylphospho-beta-D-erythro-pentofuranosid-2-ulose 2-reductase
VSADTQLLARRVLVLGGTSEIALAIVAALQRSAPREVVLAGRDLPALERAAAGLHESGCPVADAVELDALDTASHGGILDAVAERLGGLDIVVLAVGVLGDGGMPVDVGAAIETLRVNTVGAGSLLLHSARIMRRRRAGRIVVLSSVAAERPRRANFVYGAGKAGLDALARGVGDELADEGVRVLVVRPGFVRTRMTAGMPPAPLATTADAVADAVVGALDGRAQVVRVPQALRWVMPVMRNLPRPLYRRIKR